MRMSMRAMGMTLGFEAGMEQRATVMETFRREMWAKI